MRWRSRVRSRRGPPLAWRLGLLQQLHLQVSGGREVPAVLVDLAAAERGEWREVLGVAARFVREGRALSWVLAHWGLADEESWRLLAAGERADQLVEALVLAKQGLERRMMWRQSLRKVLSYPLFLMVVCGGGLGFAGSAMVPQLSWLASTGVELSWTTRSLLVLMQWTWCYCIGLLGLLLGAGVWLWSQRHQLWVGRVLLRLGVVGRVLLFVALGRFCAHMGAALRIRMGVPEAIRLAAPLMGMPILRESTLALVERIYGGLSLAEALREHPYMPEYVANVVGSSRGAAQQSETWRKLGEHFDAQAEALVARITPFVEPVMTLAVGLVIALFIHAVVLPLYQGVG